MFEAYARVAKLQDQDPEDRIAALVMCIGFEALLRLEVYEALPFADANERKSLETSVKLFEEHFLGKQNVIYERWRFNTRNQEEGETFRDYVIYERWRFNTRNQEEGETFRDYVTELRRLARGCEFDSITPQQILRDRIVCGIKDKNLIRSMIGKKDLTLDNCIEKCQSAEKTTAETERVAEKRSNVESASLYAADYKKGAGREPWDLRQTQRSQMQGTRFPNRYSDAKMCKFCGLMHDRRLCPAYGKSCAKCGRPNHFAAVCRRSGNATVRRMMEEDEHENLASLQQQESDPDGRESWQFMPVTQQENSNNAPHSCELAGTRVQRQN